MFFFSMLTIHYNITFYDEAAILVQEREIHDRSIKKQGEKSQNYVMREGKRTLRAHEK